MATFNKPGVYIQEVLSSNLPVNNISGASVGAFIGIADRGPTTTVGGNIVGVPTLVTSWEDFVNKFSFGAVTNIFSPDIFGATPNANFLGTATSDLKYAMYTFFSNGGTNAYVTRKVNSGAGKASVTVADNQGTTALNLSTGPDVSVTTTLLSASNTSTVLVATTTGIVSGQDVMGTGINPLAVVSNITSVLATSKTATAGTAIINTTAVTVATADVALGQVVSHASIPVGTYVAGIGSGAITLSATTSAAITSGTLNFTLNTLTLSASNVAPVTLGSTLSFDSTYLNFTVASTGVTITGNGTPFSSALLNNVVSFSGVSTTDSTTNSVLSSSNNFVVTSVFGGGAGITLAYSGTAGTSVIQTTGTVTITGTPSASTSGALVISANSEGAWGNNIWVGITPNQTPNYFDLTVYYGTDATITASTATASSLKSSNIVETIPQLSLNPSDARFVTNVVNSNWITVGVTGTSTNPTTRVPAFTSTWSTNSANATGASNGTFKWSANGVVSGTTAVRLGGYGVALTYSASNTNSAAVATSSAGTAFATTTSFVARTVGVSGTSGSGDPTSTLAQYDSISNQLVINYPNAFDATTVSAVLSYASTRGDSFAVIDPGTVYTTATAITTALDLLTSGNGGTLSNLNFGAVYFPNLVYSDPGSSVVGAIKSMAPGGAVVAAYCSTDTNQGAFKSPAGTSTAIGGAVPVSSLSSSDFDVVSSALRNVNIIRNVPGYGTCIMGARSIASNFSDKFVSVRRALNYLEYNLKNITQFAVFEPNDQNLWNDIIGVVGGFLNDYWTKGGLAGTTADEAFYVKCDSVINTPATISAGELRIEVGVALQRPAEFVVIKIGQTNGGTTVTTTI